MSEENDKCIQVENCNNQVIHKKEKESKSELFTYDYVFDEQTSQERLYSSLADSLFKKFFDGRHVSIITYGQSGSGKTYTLGSKYSEESSSSLGIVPRFLRDLFLKTKDVQQVDQQLVHMSFLEIHNESLKDLFDNSKKKKSSFSRKKC